MPIKVTDDDESCLQLISYIFSCDELFRIKSDLEVNKEQSKMLFRTRSIRPCAIFHFYIRTVHLSLNEIDEDKT